MVQPASAVAIKRGKVMKSSRLLSATRSVHNENCKQASGWILERETGKRLLSGYIRSRNVRLYDFRIERNPHRKADVAS